jgi:hypothetical protein
MPSYPNTYPSGHYPQIGDFVKVVDNSGYEDRLTIDSILQVISVITREDSDTLVVVPWNNDNSPDGNCLYRFALIKRADGSIPEKQKMRVIRD